MSKEKHTEAVGEAQTEAERIIAEARKEAERIIAEAKADAEAAPAEAPETESAPVKTVRITLFKDNGKYKDDVTLLVNGRVWQIQRGKEVEVPEYVARVLENSRRQDMLTADLIERESRKYEQETRAYGYQLT